MIDAALIQDAAKRVARAGLATPVAHSPSLSGTAGASVHLKLECQQPTGSFKVRGALNFMERLSPEERGRGVVCCSTGNHGRAAAHMAQAASTEATICLSSRVPAHKVEALRAAPAARVVIAGNTQDEAQEEVDRLVAAEGLVEAPPFDHPDIIAGQGTVAVELLEALPDLDLILTPLSGGGLAAGIAAAVKALRPDMRVVGVSMERGAAMAESIRAGHLVPVEEYATLADALGGGLGDCLWTWPLCRDLLDGVALVSEADIYRAIRHLWKKDGVVAEGAAAVGAAALLAGKVEVRGPVAVVVSGGNIDPDIHARIADGLPVRLGPEGGEVEIRADGP